MVRAQSPPDQPNSACCERCGKVEGEMMRGEESERAERVFMAEERWDVGLSLAKRQKHCMYMRRGSDREMGEKRKDDFGFDEQKPVRAAR